MAGQGKRMRPHTLTTPKPMIPIAGKPIVQHLLEYLIENCGNGIEHIAYVTGQFGEETEQQLLHIAQSMGASGSIHYQQDPLGTAHAILCAEDHLQGKVIIAFADTLFFADWHIPEHADGVIWVKEVKDWQQFGVVKVGADGTITDFVEKSSDYVSNLAIIGIYYFRNGEELRQELRYLIDHDIKDKGEFQLTTAMENMKNKGRKLLPGHVHKWLDCGNKAAIVHTNQEILNHMRDQTLVHPSVVVEQSTIIAPTYIGPGSTIRNSVIGPYVSVGPQTVIQSSVIANSIIQSSCRISYRIMNNSIIGNYVNLNGQAEDLSIGDYTSVE